MHFINETPSHLSAVRRQYMALLALHCFSGMQGRMLLLVSLTFCGPCIVICLCNKDQQYALFLLIFFNNLPLHISNRLTIQEEVYCTCILLYLQFTVHAVYCTCNLLYMKFTVHAVYWKCSLLYLQFTVHAVYCTRSLLNMQFTVPSVYCTCSLL